MSEYADIRIRNLSLYWFRNYLDGDVVRLLFSKRDYICIPSYIDDPDDEDSLPYTKHMYKTSVSNAKQRLDALGYSISKFEEIFNSTIQEAIYYDSFLSHLNIDLDDYEEKSLERIERNKITFKKWQNAMNKIIKHELDYGNILFHDKSDAKSIGINTECDKVIYYALKDDEQESYYGLRPDVIHIAYIFRLILESCNSNDDILLDFSNLDAWAEDCIPKAIASTEADEKIIVLVEGKNDKSILEFALNEIYPHLSDLFYFMDFEDDHGVKRDGGTSFLIKNLKAFYFSKIKSKFIAVFDNDAEGYQSKCILESEIKNWPNNFKIMLYPQDKFFESYPTILPNDTICNDDINKKACSIELYLPDSLLKESGTYYPIEWEARKSFTIQGKKINIYQGVITNKKTIESNFSELKNEIIEGKQQFIEEDWSRIKLILDSIVYAFA